MKTYIYKAAGTEPQFDVGYIDPAGCNPHYKFVGSSCFNVCAGSYPEGLDELGYVEGNCTSPNNVANNYIPTGTMDVSYSFTTAKMNSFTQNSIVSHLCNPSRQYSWR